MKKPIQNEDPLRPHSFDGIQEYDKALPNWWLFTLYITIVFSIGYWIYYQKTHMGPDIQEEYELALQQFEESVAEASQSAPEVTNETILAMSKDPAVVDEAQKHYMTNCSTCHGTELQGPPAPGLPGVSLVDNEWIHGFEPLQISHTITTGVLEKGMPSWGPVLGEKRILGLAAFILSKQASGFPESAVLALSSATAAPVPSVAPTTESAQPVSNEILMSMSQDPAVVAAGQTRFSTLCVACHGTELQGPPAPGLPGVSLVDAEWLHGNEPMQIRNTIMNGVIEKGMVPWAAVVGEAGANELVAFILSKQPK